MQIIVVRPGATELDLQGRITGTLNLPLSSKGETQALEAADALKESDIRVIYSAPCLAAKQTARMLAEKIEAKVKIDDNLLNVDHGLWQGKSLDELKSTQPKFYRQWIDNPDSVCPPGGETIEDARSRVQRFLRHVCRKHKSGTVVAVAQEPLRGILMCDLGASNPNEVFKKPSPCGGWEIVNVAEGSNA